MIFNNPFRKKNEKKSEGVQSFRVFFDERLGNYLTDKCGKTLYCFEKSNIEKNKYKTNTINKFENNYFGIWHIFYEEDIIVPPTFKKKDFFNIERSDGLMQTTYRGCPLYYYGNDLNSGDIKGEGINGEWFVAKIKQK